MPLPRRARSVADMPPESLRCQLYRRHAFPLPAWADDVYDGIRCWTATVRCDCGCERTMHAYKARPGDPVELIPGSSRYWHPDGVLPPAGTTTGDIRAETVGLAQAAQDAADARVVAEGAASLAAHRAARAG